MRNVRHHFDLWRSGDEVASQRVVEVDGKDFVLPPDADLSQGLEEFVYLVFEGNLLVTTKQVWYSRCAHFTAACVTYHDSTGLCTIWRKCYIVEFAVEINIFSVCVGVQTLF